MRDPFYDPVARSIQNEQNRDAMPSRQEIRRKAEEDRQCDKCGEYKATAKRRERVLPDCPAIQHPRDPTRILCWECADARDTLVERAIENAQQRNSADYYEATIVAVAMYECGRSEYVEEPEAPTMEVEEQVGWNYKTGEPITETVEVEHPHADARPSAPIECECGAALDDVHRLDE